MLFLQQRLPQVTTWLCKKLLIYAIHAFNKACLPANGKNTTKSLALEQHDDQCAYAARGRPAWINEAPENLVRHQLQSAEIIYTWGTQLCRGWDGCCMPNSI